MLAWIIVATNRRLGSLVEQGIFRSDLYYRLNVMSLSMPSLRERGDDILLLANHSAQVLKRYRSQFQGFTDNACARLLNYAWPGNVREMKYLIEHAILLSGGGILDQDILGFDKKSFITTRSERQETSDDLVLGEAELLLIKQALERTERNVSKAARELRISRMALLRYRIKKYNL